MEIPPYYQIFLLNLLKIIAKSVAGGIGFAIIGLEAKKAWKKEQKWRLAMTFGAIIFGFLLLFLEF